MMMSQHSQSAVAGNLFDFLADSIYDPCLCLEIIVGSNELDEVADERNTKSRNHKWPVGVHASWGVESNQKAV